jgi:hypothetical protein
VILRTGAAYLKVSDTAGDEHSGVVMQSIGNASGVLYHTSYVGASTLDIDAKPASASYASIIRYGYNTTALSRTHEFYGEITGNGSISITKASGSATSLLSLTASSGSDVMIEHNQDNGTRYYSGTRYKRNSTEYWLVGMTDADDNYHIKDSVSGVDAIKITTSTDAVELVGSLTMPSASITQAGTLKAITNFLTLNNTAGAADNDGTGTAIYVKQAASDLNLYDCGRMYWVTEGDWTSTAADRDSSLLFQVALNGTLTTKLTLSSSLATFANGITVTSGSLILSSGSITVSSGSFNITGSIYVDKASALYWSNTGGVTDGDFRILISGGTAYLQKRVSGTYSTAAWGT